MIALLPLQYILSAFSAIGHLPDAKKNLQDLAEPCFHQDMPSKFHG